MENRAHGPATFSIGGLGGVGWGNNVHVTCTKVMLRSAYVMGFGGGGVGAMTSIPFI